MASGLLSLKWNNHRSTFFHVLSSIRSKESYCDATLACDGRFYPVHKLVLSTCSEYFEQIFERTQCKHPVIVLKDIKFDDLEALMNYMYVGEVNVLQEKLSGLIKAAECLKIKGLAVPDEDPFASKENRRNQHRVEYESPRAKRRRREDSFQYEERTKNISSRERPSPRERQSLENHESINLGSPKATELTSPEASVSTFSKSDKTSDVETNLKDDDNCETIPKNAAVEEAPKKVSCHKRKTEIVLVETNVKAEPPDIEIPAEEDLDSKENLHSDLGYDPSGGDQDSMGGDESGSAHGGNDSEFSENVLESAPQSVEDVVAQALPSSSFQGNSFSLWEGESSLQNFPGEGFSGENSQGRPMVGGTEVDPLSNHSSTVRNVSSFSHFVKAAVGERQNALYMPEVEELPRHSEDSSSALANILIHGTNTKFTSQAGYSLPLESSKNFEKGLRCSLCAKCFPSMDLFSEHLSVHPSNIAISCPVCGTNVPHSNDLLQHLRIHKEEMNIVGRKPLTDEYSMSRKRFSCSVCPYKAFNRSNLNIHLRMHTGEKPFACSLCTYRANHKGNLVSHMRTHAIQKFSCSVCRRKFVEKHEFEQHMCNLHGIPNPGEGSSQMLQ